MSSCCSSRPESPCHQSQKFGRSNANTKGLSQVQRPKKTVLEVRGGEHLEELHPTLAHKARLLYERAEDQGVMVRFISGYRPYRPKKNVKKNGSLASWHSFGAAFDLNLVGRKGMKDALKHLKEDLKKWKRLGRIAQELDLTWGRPWGDTEIFHFEWHPGHPEALRKKAFNKLTKVTGKKVTNYKAAWRLFKEGSQK